MSNNLDRATARKLTEALVGSLPDDIPQEVALGWLENEKALRQVLRQLAVLPEAGNAILWIGLKYEPMYYNSDALVEFLEPGFCKSSDVAVERMKGLGYRPAKDPEVFRNCNKHPELPGPNCSIVVLGSPWWDRHGDRRVLILSRDVYERLIWLDWWDKPRSGRYLYAAVKI